MTVAAIVLAAGRSERMAGTNKLLAAVGGVPLVRIAANAAVESRAAPVTVVTGHDADDVVGALAGVAVAVVHNADYMRGLSTSLRAGLATVPADADGVVILLGDMPEIGADAVNRLIDAFEDAGGDSIVVAAHRGQRGNPVLWPRRFFTDLMVVEGDTGGRALIEANTPSVIPVEIGPAAAADIDTPEALATAQGRG